MKSRAVFVLILSLFPAWAFADTYLKQSSHTDGFYQGGAMNPPEDKTTEIWIGERQLALIVDGWRFVADPDSNRLTVINLRDKSYLQTTLPLEMAKILPEQEAPALAMFKSQGKAASRAESRRIDGRDCRRWDLRQWIMYEGQPVDEQETTAWYSTGLAVPPDRYAIARRIICAMRNLDDGYAAALREIPGIEVAAESVRYTEGLAVKTSSRLTEISVKEPPAGVYAVPPDFKTREKYSIRDFR